ncbi:MAG: hypothetical protein INR72_07300 [Williamsia herbipolensis]|uniref:Uncharacterized protein n=1 Tax=Williamsia serinedens TaxID=391736 RepID=A0ABT1H5F6_9NOCA|nr:hypothetical protein [Williamsia serinedens]MBE7161037.1 hypothetical protein [Williamsia herbipolensis]MCP2162189.1 hypothetical protein [Williamsia serinedens]
MILATHSLLLALPAFVPAVLLVGVIVTVAVRDRRRGDDDGEELPLEDWGGGRDTLSDADPDLDDRR